jgi:hypothetical protein
MSFKKGDMVIDLSDNTIGKVVKVTRTTIQIKYIVVIEEYEELHDDKVLISGTDSRGDQIRLVERVHESHKHDFMLLRPAIAMKVFDRDLEDLLS